MTDRIELTGLTVRGRHGVLDAERDRDQEFVIDVALFTDHHRAAETDDLEDTIDYGEMAGRVGDIVGAETHHLIETVADRVAASVLEDSRVQRVVVTVHKPEAPIPVPFADVSVTVDRHR